MNWAGDAPVLENHQFDRRLGTPEDDFPTKDLLVLKRQWILIIAPR